MTEDDSGYKFAPYGLGTVKNGVLNVDKVPNWVASGDPIVKKGNRLVLQSLALTEPRWRQMFRRFVAPRIRKVLDD